MNTRLVRNLGQRYTRALPMDLRSTLNLPDPAFSIPMKANLPELEPRIQAEWESQDLYHKIQEARRDAPSFVLHDGPPYTNSPIHIGTALNKLLKDFVVKSRTMLGYRAPYVPGYDNHGLPIEQTVMKTFHERKEIPSVVELRKACRAHAKEYIDVQTSQFKRLGILGLWEKPYATMDFRFEAEIIRVFARMAAGGYVYRGLRPTLWSPTSRTALADTEIVYQDHTSTSIYVRFPLKSDPNKLLRDYSNVFAVIWTTTPWTIPGNLAIAFHPEMAYVVVRVGDEHYLLYEGLVEKVATKLGWTNHTVVGRFEGVNFDHMMFEHPVFGRDSLGVLADYVTTEDGTGVVHTAPGHGRDDFHTGMRYGLPILCPVDEKGILTEEAGEFAGVSYKECDKVVVDRLREKGHLLNVEPYEHSYPYAERDGKPVIFRATEQWFVSIDQSNLRQRMLSVIEPRTLDEHVAEEERGERPDSGVNWIPSNGYNRISAMVANRPDWCISRQRPWGVGIPVFFGAQSREPVLDAEAIEAVASLVDREGSDAWFEKDPKDILPKGYTHPTTGETEFTKEKDVLDVWFDSGSTSLCVLEGNVEPAWKEDWPADLYLEGSDQHRGWFNSSLVIGVATKGKAPYRQVLTHGWVMDAHGRKMSKRLGNVVDPVEACEKYGADIVRHWVATVDWQNDVPCSDSLLKNVGELYRSIRNTLRFLLGNLYDFDPDAPRPQILELDEWAMEQVDLLVADVVDAYKRYDFNKVLASVHNFCVNELSRFYLDAIKDRMYCDGADWPSRRSGQWACWYVLERLVKLIAPVLAHTAEETWMAIPWASGSVHEMVFDHPSRERLDEIEASALQSRFAALLALRGQVFADFEAWKQTSETKDSQDVKVLVSAERSALESLKGFTPGDLATYFKMSEVVVVEGKPGSQFNQSEYLKCERSRIRRPDVTPTQIPGLEQSVPLSARDRNALGL